MTEGRALGAQTVRHDGAGGAVRNALRGPPLGRYWIDLVPDKRPQVDPSNGRKGGQHRSPPRPDGWVSIPPQVPSFMASKAIGIKPV